MRHKNALPTLKRPLNLNAALIEFGKLKSEHPEYSVVARLGMRLVREIQHHHRMLREIRATLPRDYDGYFDPLRVDAMLARTTVNGKIAPSDDA